MPTNKMLTLVGIVLMSPALWSSAHAETLKLDYELTVYYEVTGTGHRSGSSARKWPRAAILR
jgi:hypothetical protein